MLNNNLLAQGKDLKSINSIIFLLVFILPIVAVYFVPNANLPMFLNIYLVINILAFLSNSKKIFQRRNTRNAVYFTILLLISAFLSSVAKNEYTVMNYLSPIIGLTGFSFLANKQIKLNYLWYLIVGCIILFWTTYFANLDSYVFRSGYDENVYERSSSNTVPIVLFYLSYLYLWLKYNYNKTIDTKDVFIFGIMSALIIIQQSRIGVVVFLYMFFILMYYKTKRYAWILIISSIILAVYLYFNGYISLYIETVGNISIGSVEEDIRGRIRNNFYDNITQDVQNFVFGLSRNTNLDYAKDQYRVYNMFLDCWKGYGFIAFVVLSAVVFMRVIRSNRIRLILLVPFLLYTYVETLFLGGFADLMLYYVLFSEKFDTDD